VAGGLNRFTVEPVYCLGLCVTSSSALLGSEPLGRLDANKITVALDEARIVMTRIFVPEDAAALAIGAK
jgi:hypothetical protein